MTDTPNFSPESVAFLKKAARQKNPQWLESHKKEYEDVLRRPLVHLMSAVSKSLRPIAPDYHFPLKGIGRLKRPANKPMSGGGLYKSWMAYSASRPKVSRFESNPNLFFLINSEDPKDTVLIAGGLYMPSSKQVRLIREAIARDAGPFEKLFKDPKFARAFPGGFSDEKSATRMPRGFESTHPKADWIRLQAFFVWKPYPKKIYSSKKLAATLAEDWKQILRLNRLLEDCVSGKGWAKATKGKVDPLKKISAIQKIENVTGVAREMDF